jgi:hypothetical protein
MRQFQDEGLNFEVFGLDVESMGFDGFSIFFHLIQKCLNQCRHLCFGGSIKVQIIQLLKYSHGIVLPQKASLTSINAGFLAIFQPSKIPLIRLVNGRAAEPINVANPPRQSATPTVLA